MKTNCVLHKKDGRDIELHVNKDGSKIKSFVIGGKDNIPSAPTVKGTKGRVVVTVANLPKKEEKASASTEPKRVAKIRIVKREVPCDMIGYRKIAYITMQGSKELETRYEYKAL